MTSWLIARKNSRRAMAAVSASPPIGATAAAFVAGREAGLSIKPLIARNGQRYGANGDRDRRVFDERWRVRPLSNFLVFLAGPAGPHYGISVLRITGLPDYWVTGLRQS